MAGGSAPARRTPAADDRLADDRLGHDQLQHDVMAWVAGGHHPQMVPLPVRPARLAHAVEALLAGGPDALVWWSPTSRRYALTDAGQLALDGCTAHTTSEVVTRALAAAEETWEQAG